MPAMFISLFGITACLFALLIGTDLLWGHKQTPLRVSLNFSIALVAAVILYVILSNS